MKVLCLSLLMLSLSAFGQAFTPRRPFVYQLASTVNTNPEPQQLAGLYLWWNSGDTLSQGTNVVITNWIDRIQGWVFTNETSATRPSNSTNGVVFDGVDDLLTNVVAVNQSSIHSLTFLVLQWDLNSSVSPTFLMYSAGTANQIEWFHNAGQTWGLTYNPPASGCSRCDGGIQTNVLMTVAMLDTAGNSYSYTNGIVSKTGCGTGNLQFNELGGIDYWPFKGRILDLIVYTNNADSTYVPVLQHYANTNYGVPLWP